MNNLGTSDMSLFFIVVLVILAVGIAPVWPHSRNWGYYPSGGTGLLLIVLLVLILTGHRM